jgi:hypothetical protein
MKRLVSMALVALTLGQIAPAQDILKDAVLPVETKYLNSPTASQYPESNAIFLNDAVTFRVSADGSTEYDEHDVIKVFTPAGVEDHKDLLRVYRSDLEKVEVDLARTILPDGRVLEVPKAAIVDEAVFDPAETKVHQFMRRVVIRYPGVTPNSIVEYRIRTKKKPYPLGKWWGVSYVQNPEPMVESRFEVDVPSGMPVHFATPGYTNLVPEKSSHDGIDSTVYKIVQSPPLTQEASGPALLTQMKRLEASNFDNWSQLRSWFQQGFDASCETTGAVQTQTQRLLTAGATPTQQLIDIGTWATHKRFLSGSLDDFRPNKANQLVDEQVLNPVDAAVLLTSMYRVAGFTVQPVLAFELPPEQVQTELPRFNRVDTLLLQVKNGTQSWWIDPRHPLEFDDAPPSGFQGGSALLAGDEQQPFQRLESTAADANRVETQVEARLDDKGRLELRFNTVEHGASGAAYREASRELLDSGKEQRDQQLSRLFERIAANYGTRARVLDKYFNLNARQGQPIDFAATVAVPDYTVRMGNKLAMIMPVRVNPQMINLADSTGARTQPIRLDHPWREDVRLRLHLPANTELSELPATVQINSPFGSYFATARGEGREVYYYSRLVVNEALIPKEQAGELAQFARQVVQARGKLVLTPVRTANKP